MTSQPRYSRPDRACTFPCSRSKQLLICKMSRAPRSYRSSAFCALNRGAMLRGKAQASQRPGSGYRQPRNRACNGQHPPNDRAFPSFAPPPFDKTAWGRDGTVALNYSISKRREFSHKPVQLTDTLTLSHSVR